VHSESPSKTITIFGQFLHESGVITFDDIVRARRLQRQRNRRIGERAREKGWLSAADIEVILILQEHTLLRFGDIAVQRNYLTGEQLATLVKEQEDDYLFFGEALVEIGVISKLAMLEHLVAFHNRREESAGHLPARDAADHADPTASEP